MDKNFSSYFTNNPIEPYIKKFMSSSYLDFEEIFKTLSKFSIHIQDNFRVIANDLSTLYASINNLCTYVAKLNTRASTLLQNSKEYLDKKYADTKTLFASLLGIIKILTTIRDLLVVLCLCAYAKETTYTFSATELRSLNIKEYTSLGAMLNSKVGVPTDLLSIAKDLISTINMSLSEIDKKINNDMLDTLSHHSQYKTQVGKFALDTEALKVNTDLLKGVYSGFVVLDVSEPITPQLLLKSEYLYQDYIDTPINEIINKLYG